MTNHFVWGIDPNIFHYGSIQLRWYGVLFVSSFFVGLWALERIYRREGKDTSVLENFLMYLIVGAVIGARLAHCLFYEPDFYLSHPLEILYVWKGGLASHGGMIGTLVAIYVFAKRYDQSYIWLVSRETIAGTITAIFVRVGNFFNSEILGLPSDKPWAIVFSRIDSVPRHPVQLYEALSYTLLLVLLVLVYRKATESFATKILPAIFLSTMFIVRFLLEYTKTRQADYTTDLPLTTGQMLSVPFIVVGLIWLIWAIASTKREKRWQSTH